MYYKYEIKNSKTTHNKRNKGTKTPIWEKITWKKKKKLLKFHERIQSKNPNLQKRKKDSTWGDSAHRRTLLSISKLLLTPSFSSFHTIPLFLLRIRRSKAWKTGAHLKSNKPQKTQNEIEEEMKGKMRSLPTTSHLSFQTHLIRIRILNPLQSLFLGRSDWNCSNFKDWWSRKIRNLTVSEESDQRKKKMKWKQERERAAVVRLG